MNRSPIESSEKAVPATRSRARAALVAGLITVTLFALTPTTTRLAIAQVDGLQIGLSRTVGGGVIAIVLIILLRIRPPRDRTQCQILGLFSLGCFVAFPLLFSIGAQTTSATHASLIMACMPVVTSALGFVLDRRKPGAAWLAGAALALFGEIVLIIATEGTPSVQSTVVGDLTVFISCVSFCIGAVAGSRMAARMGAVQATFWAISVAGIGLLPVAVAESAKISIGFITPVTWLALIHLSLGASLIACITWSFALEHGGIPRIAPLQFAQPILALSFAAVLLGEGISAVTLSCAIAILVGLAITWRNAASRAVSWPVAPTAQVGERGPRFIRSLVSSYRDFSERLRAQRDLSHMDHSQIKDLGFPTEADKGEGRARWRRD